jgi:hypothetical protein
LKRAIEPFTCGIESARGALGIGERQLRVGGGAEGLRMARGELEGPVAQFQRFLPRRARGRQVVGADEVRPALDVAEPPVGGGDVGDQDDVVRLLGLEFLEVLKGEIDDLARRVLRAG